MQISRNAYSGRQIYSQHFQTAPGVNTPDSTVLDGSQHISTVFLIRSCSALLDLPALFLKFQGSYW